MIAVSAPTLLLGLVGAGLLVLSLLWIPQLWYKHPQRWTTSELQICRCPRCHFSFFVHPQQPQPTCPACQERFRFRCRGRFLRY